MLLPVQGAAQLLVDGLRVGLRADGSYTLGAGWLPLGREVMVLTLPTRLGGGHLFVLVAADDTWFFRAKDFTSTLEPLGRLDQAVETVTVGFTALRVRLRASGALIALETDPGRLSEDLELPDLPEYGPVAVVDDWFGAYVDPLRGLMVTLDAGARYELFPPGRGGNDVSASPVVGLRADDEGLQVTLLDRSQFLLTRRGDDLVANPQAGPFRAAAPERARDVKSWIARLRDSTLGGWPIELALSRGLRLEGNVAVYINEGTLYFVTLDTGEVIGSVVTKIPRDQQCFGATAQRRNYFLCHDRTGSALYRFEGKSSLFPLGYWTQQRPFGAVSDAGVIVKGPCAATGSSLEAPRSYCSVSPSGEHFEFQVPEKPAQWLPLAVADGQAVAFELPSPNHPGALHWFGTRRGVTRVRWPESGNGFGLLEEGFFLRELSLLQGMLAGYVVRGGGIQGYRVTLDGALRLGPVVTGAAAALTKGPLALVPDSSGYAYESLDGGMNWQRTELPITVANTVLSLPQSTTEYGCNSVGCILGDWLRLGWSAPAQTVTRQLPSRYAMLESPPLLSLTRRRRRMPQITCQATGVYEPLPIVPRFAHPRYGEPGVPLSTAFDVGGQQGLLVFDDAGKKTGYLLAADQRLTELPDLLGHSPTRITDFVSLKEASYLLGTEPQVALFELRGQAVRVLSDEDFRARLSHARLRLVRDRDATRIAYLLSSIRLRSVDVVWLIYPIDLRSGKAEMPLRIPLDLGLRVCEADDDGWLIQTELDDVAVGQLLPDNVDVIGRGQALLRASEQGLCVERVSFTGQLSAAKLTRRPSVGKPKSGFGGFYQDLQGHARPLSCDLTSY